MADDNPRINKELRENVRRLHKDRYSVRKTATELGVSASRVQTLRREMGLRPPRKRSQIKTTRT